MRNENWREDFDFDNDDKLMEDVYPASSSSASHTRGGYYYGFEYNIVPLNTNLSTKGNDAEHIQDYEDEYNDLYVGDYVSGISPRDGKEYKGRITSFSYKNDSGTEIKFVYILDEKTSKILPLVYKSVKKIETDFIDHPRSINPYTSPHFHLHESAKDNPNRIRLFDNNKDDGCDFDSESGYRMYRKYVIDHTNMNDDFVKYFDDKFGGVYKNNIIYVNDIYAVPFVKMCGINYKNSDDKKRYKNTIKQFFAIYANLTHREISKVSVEWKHQGMQNLGYQSALHTMEVRNWYDIYCMVIAFEKCWQMNRYAKGFELHKNRYNVSCNSNAFKAYTNALIIKMLVPDGSRWGIEKKFDEDKQEYVNVVDTLPKITPASLGTEKYTFK